MSEQVSRKAYARRFRHYLAFNRRYPAHPMTRDEIMKAIDHELFAPFAFPGGYPILYIDANGDTLCADCARLWVLHDGYDPTDPDFSKLRPELSKTNTLAMDIFYEGAPVNCANCNIEIESAYGDPDADEIETIDGIEVRTFRLPSGAYDHISANALDDDDVPF